jgi:trk system potassium uptake protein TrkH
MNYKGILFFLGIYSLIVSLFSILNIFYSIYFEFIAGLNSYLMTFSISGIAGFLFCYVGRNHNKDITLTDQIIFILLGFVLIPCLISIPYLFSIYDIGLLNSYFESISGFTTTGFSIIQNINNIDEPLILWRSSSQWLGGLLFLLATIGTIGSKQIKIKPAYLISGGASGRNFYNNFTYNFIKILLIYFFSTLLVIFLYNLTDVRLLDAFNLAFTTISTGGFIPTDNLSNIMESNLQIFVLSITLLLPILNFFFLHDVITKKFSFRNYQEDLHLVLLVILLTLFLYFFVIPNFGFANVLFAITSSVSTSGITTYSSNLDLDLSLFFILLTVIGGSLISTSSGFKYTRIYILLKISYQEIYRLVKPINVIDKNLYNSEAKIDDQDVKIAFLAFLTFIISIFILSSILALDYLTFENSFKLSILTLTNTVSSALYGFENLSFSDLNNFTKMSLILFMILGKIEIITVIYLIKRFIFRE